MGYEQCDTTIVIPFHSDDLRLIQAVNSVLAQDDRGWVLELHSDGAPEAFVEWLRDKYEQRNVRVLHDGRNLGLGARLNRSIETCETEFYMRMDADDVMHPSRLGIQRKVLRDNDQYSIVASTAFAFDDSLNVLGYFLVGKDRTPTGLISTPILDPIRSATPLIHPSVMFRTDWVRKNRYSEKLRRTEDLELWMRGIDGTNCFVVDQPLLFFRIAHAQGGFKTHRTAWEERQIAFGHYGVCLASLKFALLSLAKEAAKSVLEASGRSGMLRENRFGRIEDPAVVADASKILRAVSAGVEGAGGL